MIIASARTARWYLQSPNAEVLDTGRRPRRSGRGADDQALSLRLRLEAGFD
jgi:hypothetical protein